MYTYKDDISYLAIEISSPTRTNYYDIEFTSHGIIEHLKLKGFHTNY